MTEELDNLAMVFAPKIEEPLQVVVDVSRPAPPFEPLTPEQVQAHDAVFAQQEQDATAVANLLGLWTCSVLFADMIGDQFRAPVEEEEDRRKLGPKLVPEPEPRLA